MTPKQKKTGMLKDGGEKENAQNAGELSFRFLSPTRSVTSSTNQKTPGSTVSVARTRSTIASMKKRTKRKSDVRRGIRGGLQARTPDASAAKRQKSEEQKRDKSMEIAKFLPVILPLLKKIGFKHSSTFRYRHPFISQRFDTAALLRNFLVAHGIPNISLIESTEEKQELENWVKFAHVSLHDWSSASSSGFGSLNLSKDILPDEEIQRKVLPAVGFENGTLNQKSVFLAPGASDLPSDTLEEGVHYFLTLDEVRVYVRSNEILATTSPGKIRIRSRKEPTSKDERSQERLWLRLWGATSKESLPVFEDSSNGTVVSKSPSQVAASESPSIEAAACPATGSPQQQHKKARALLQLETPTLPPFSEQIKTAASSLQKPRTERVRDEPSEETEDILDNVSSGATMTQPILDLPVSRIAIGMKVFCCDCKLQMNEQTGVLEFFGRRSQGSTVAASPSIAKISFEKDIIQEFNWRIDSERIHFLALQLVPTHCNHLITFANSYQHDSGDDRKKYVVVEFLSMHDLEELLNYLDRQPRWDVEGAGLTTAQAPKFALALLDERNNAPSKESHPDVVDLTSLQNQNDNQANNRGNEGDTGASGLSPAVRKYRALRAAINMQRELRDYNTKKILGPFVTIKEDPIPEAPSGNIDAKNQQLELELESIRMEIRLLLQQPPFEN